MKFLANALGPAAPRLPFQRADFAKVHEKPGRYRVVRRFAFREVARFLLRTNSGSGRGAAMI